MLTKSNMKIKSMNLRKKKKLMRKNLNILNGVFLVGYSSHVMFARFCPLNIIFQYCFFESYRLSYQAKTLLNKRYYKNSCANDTGNWISGKAENNFFLKFSNY